MGIYPEIDRIFAENTAEEILKDLEGRSGFGGILDVGDDVLQDITDAIVEIIDREMPLIIIDDEDEEE